MQSKNKQDYVKEEIKEIASRLTPEQREKMAAKVKERAMLRLRKTNGKA